MMSLNIDFKIVGNNRLEYQYDVDDSLKSILSQDPFFVEYNVDISNVESSILCIPFVANLMPIAWNRGINVYCDKLDLNFFNALKVIQHELNSLYPGEFDKGKLICNELIDNSLKMYDGKKSIVFYSGGVDSYAALIKNIKSNFNCFSVWGADIEISEEKRWNDFVKHAESDEVVKNVDKIYCKSNLKDFYNRAELNKFRYGSWWGRVQHGLGLIALSSPVSMTETYTEVIFGATHTENIKIPWGSTKVMDESIKWAQIEVNHEGYELERVDKVKLITNYIKQESLDFNIRVCYSEIYDKFNCGTCEKCIRTAFNFAMLGINPNDISIPVQKGFIKTMLKYSRENFSYTKGNIYNWQRLTELANNTPYNIIIPLVEKKQYDYIRAGEIIKNMTDNYNKKTWLKSIYTFYYRVKNYLLRDR
ncbi:hypothetical protein AB4504_21955 [Vibrio sp. 10N.222.55.F12]|uniref:hypothetical protein n=1 Tax=Vibrio sp. 10N.222.55.F12 TaxID=3229653 RepID=UPI003553581D